MRRGVTSTEMTYGNLTYYGLIEIGAVRCDDGLAFCGATGPCAGNIQGADILIPASGRVHAVANETLTETDQQGHTIVHHFYYDARLRFTGAASATGTWKTNNPDADGQVFGDPPPPSPCGLAFTAAPR